MTVLAGEARLAIGARVAAARRDRGMTQRDLAQALGVSSWIVDRIECGAVDARRYLPSIADVTRTSPDWLAASTKIGARPRTKPETLPHLGVAGRNLVLGSIVLLVTIRFFTEVVPVIPRAANFVDIPIFLALAFAVMTITPGHRGPAYLRLGLPAAVFIVLAIASAAINSDRTEPAPAIVFIYGFLAPLGVYAAVYRIWPPGTAGSLSRVLVWLGLLQLAVVVLVDLPRYAPSGNPDLITGTFGTNAYQLVFFLLLVAALLAGIFALEPGRKVARFAPFLILAIFGTILLAQYRALLATTVVMMAVVGILLGTRVRGVVVAACAVVAFGLAFAYVASTFPRLKLNATATTLTESPTTYAMARYEAMGPVAGLYRDIPQAIAIGSGPGTFSSRAWQTFAKAGSTSASNVQGGYAQKLTRGVYETDVSKKYIDPQLREGVVIEGSSALSSPYSTYLSLAAEIGLLGLAVIAGVYLTVLLRIFRISRQLIVHATPDDPLPALALATTVAFLTLLQMGFLENWLEVTRITFIAWAMLAVVAKELDSRPAAAS